MSFYRIGDEIKWTQWTAGDGVKDGKDVDGIWYVKDAIAMYTEPLPDPNNRVGVFWVGGFMTQDDFDKIREFIKIYTGSKGKIAYDVFPTDIVQSLGLNKSNKNGLWWRAINRACKSLSAAAFGGTAYVYTNNNNCRHLFSPPSQHPRDSDPDHGGQATNGEIWYYTELPTLMRNLNIDKIVTFYKTGQPSGSVQNVAWDVDRVGILLPAVMPCWKANSNNQDKDKPRDFLEDFALDVSPIILPPDAGRSPLKHKIIARDGAAPIMYQEGLFDVKPLLAPSLTSDSATVCTATDFAKTITTTVPIWSCSTCPAPYNAIFVSPVSVAGTSGIPSVSRLLGIVSGPRKRKEELTRF
ncbi:MAG: hypothetical protein Q9181_006429 [Wetmoreana brouardii]